MARILLLALAAAVSTASAHAAGPTPPLKVLFLGDRGHHNPADRAAQLAPVMAGRGSR